MKKSTKVSLGIGIILMTGLLLTSCNSFCTTEDISHYRYGYDPINTTYFENADDAKDYIVDSINELDVIQESGTTITFDDLQIYVYDDTYGEKTLRTISDDEDTYLEYIIKKYNDNLVYLVPNNVYVDYSVTSDSGTSTTERTYITIGLNSFTASVMNTCISSGIITPGYSFFEELDKLTLEKMISNSVSCGYDWLEDSNLTQENITFKDIYGYTYDDYLDYLEDPTDEKLDALLGEDDGYGNPTRTATQASASGYGRNYSLSTTLGYLKFDNSSLLGTSLTIDDEDFDAYAQLEAWNEEIADIIGFDQVMTASYFSQYQTTMETYVSSLKTCITIEDGFYGHLGSDPLTNTVRISAKASNYWSGWRHAFSEHGFFEGLLVYPISTMLESFSHAFGMGGSGQILAVILVTFIVRFLFMAITFPATLSQQKMQTLQPEIAKLQQKYPNYDSNDYEKRRYAEAQMALYKKYKIHPFLSMFITLVIQFPLFICVWNAMQGSASLSRDSFLGLVLSDTIWGTLTNVSGWPALPGWWTALVLILLMSAAQIGAMILPNILHKLRLKKIQKLGNVQAQDKQQKTMKYVQIGMTIFIIIMGFTLPSAMGVYWLCGAIFSMIQTTALHFVSLKMSSKLSDD